MNRDKLERWSLLDEAGELGGVRRWLLRRALARDRELAAFRQGSLELTRLSRAASPNRPLPPASLGAIRQEAAQVMQEQRDKAPSIHHVRPAFALGAAAALAIAAYFGFPRAATEALVLNGATASLPTEWNAIDDDLAALNQLLASSFDTAEVSADEEESLARELLKLEGTEI